MGLGRLSGSLGVSGGPGVSSAVATAAAGELPQTAAVMEGVLDALLQRTLSNMAGRLVSLSSLVACNRVQYPRFLSLCVRGCAIDLAVESLTQNRSNAMLYYCVV